MNISTCVQPAVKGKQSFASFMGVTPTNRALSPVIASLLRLRRVMRRVARTATAIPEARTRYGAGSAGLLIGNSFPPSEELVQGTPVMEQVKMALAEWIRDPLVLVTMTV